MPTIKSAKKRLKTTARQKQENQKRKNEMKDAVNKLKDLIDEGKKEEAEEQLALTYKALDKAAKHNIIHENKAARRKSFLAKKVDELE